MKTKNALLIVGIAMSAFSMNADAQPSGTAASTRPATTAPGTLSTPTGVASNIARAEAAGDAGALVLAYGEATRDPQLARITLTQLLTDYFKLRALATSAMQASQAVDEAGLRFSIFQAAQNQVNVQQNQQILQQNQKLIDQNDAIIKQNARMIDLLDQIARKK